MRCERCLTEQEGEEGSRTLVVLDGRELDELAAAMTDESLAADRCRACREPLGTRPVVVVLTDDAAHVTADAGEWLDSVASTPLEELGLDLELKVHPSVEALRGALAGQFVPAIGAFNEWSTTDTADRDEWLDENWRRVDGRVFLAIVLAAGGALPGSLVAIGGSEDGASDDERAQAVMDVLANLQGAVLQRLAIAALEQSDLQLDAALERIFPPLVTLPDALERFQAMEDAVGDTLGPLQRYVLHAIHASGCAAYGAPNASAEIWAALWLGFELARRELDAGDLDRFSLSPNRARATLETEALWDAVAGRLLDDDPARRGAARRDRPQRPDRADDPDGVAHRAAGRRDPGKAAEDRG